jgi:hypothetical protein
MLVLNSGEGGIMATCCIEKERDHMTPPFCITYHQDYVAVLFRLAISSRLVKLKILICLSITFGFGILWAPFPGFDFYGLIEF